MDRRITAELSKKERVSFVSVTDTGLLDILLASFTSMFALAPLLSRFVGDFWSSAVFIPFWIVVYLVVREVNEKVVIPRVGRVRWGARRQLKLKATGWAMLVVNTVVFAIGAVAYFTYQPASNNEWGYPATLSLALLVLLSIGAYALSLPRLFVYAILLAISPAVGEYLFQAGLASHHGFPVVFGAASVLIGCVGLLKLAKLMKLSPPIVGTPD
ncbi:MAG: hypothetical protein QNJ11_13695 [Woeseiaceae bacterium]|nr:hypothetical protein [Woeseiaceae bacterium]